MSQSDLYALLGVSQSASAAELKSAYRKLAMKYHPDRNPGDKAAEDKFKEISKAYEILGDPQKRAQYDQYGSAAFEQGAGSGGAGGFGGGGFSDIFEDIFSNFMGGGAGGSSSGGSQGYRGDDVRVDVALTLEEARTGVEKTIKVNVAQSCEVCHGHGTKDPNDRQACGQCGGAGVIRMQQGFFMMERPCASCNGQGYTIRNKCKSCGGAGVKRGKKELKVKIPAGVMDGTRMRVSGKGDAGAQGGTPGDLYVFISVKKHPLFERDDENLYCKMPITLIDAILGSTHDLKALDGEKIQLKIPAGTQFGDVIRIKGKGMPVYGRSIVGDLYVEIEVEIPKNLSKKQRETLEKFYDGVDAKKNQPSVDSFWTKVKKLWGTDDA